MLAQEQDTDLSGVVPSDGAHRAISPDLGGAKVTGAQVLESILGGGRDQETPRQTESAHRPVSSEELSPKIQERLRTSSLSIGHAPRELFDLYGPDIQEIVFPNNELLEAFYYRQYRDEREERGCYWVFPDGIVVNGEGAMYFPESADEKVIAAMFGSKLTEMSTVGDSSSALVSRVMLRPFLYERQNNNEAEESKGQDWPQTHRHHVTNAEVEPQEGWAPGLDESGLRVEGATGRERIQIESTEDGLVQDMENAAYVSQQRYLEQLKANARGDRNRHELRPVRMRGEPVSADDAKFPDLAQVYFGDFGVKSAKLVEKDGTLGDLVTAEARRALSEKRDLVGPDEFLSKYRPVVVSPERMVFLDKSSGEYVLLDRSGQKSENSQDVAPLPHVSADGKMEIRYSRGPGRWRVARVPVDALRTERARSLRALRHNENLD